MVCTLGRALWPSRPWYVLAAPGLVGSFVSVVGLGSRRASGDCVAARKAVCHFASR